MEKKIFFVVSIILYRFNFKNIKNKKRMRLINGFDYFPYLSYAIFEIIIKNAF